MCFIQNVTIFATIIFKYFFSFTEDGAAVGLWMGLATLGLRQPQYRSGRSTTRGRKSASHWTVSKHQQSHHRAYHWKVIKVHPPNKSWKASHLINLGRPGVDFMSTMSCMPKFWEPFSGKQWMVNIKTLWTSVQIVLMKWTPVVYLCFIFYSMQHIFALLGWRHVCIWKNIEG